MSNSVQPHRRQPTRLPHPWGSPGKNTGVGCHFLHPEKTIIWKDTCTSVFTAALLTMAKTQKQPKCPSTGVTKRWYIYTVEVCSAIKKNEMPFAATWMGLKIIILSEVSQRKTNIMWCHLYSESKTMTQVHLFTKPEQTHRLWKQTYGLPKGQGGTNKLRVWDDVYRLLYLKEMTNRDLLNDTGHSAQYL